MDLFNQLHTNPLNLLPMDGEVLYYNKLVSFIDANAYYTNFLNTIFWQNDKALIFGKEIITKRKVAWYGDTNFNYTYSKYTKQALIWTDELLKLKKIVELISGHTYNSCLLNLYHSGAEGMAWHSDGEKELLKNGAIASVSFGAERKFLFKHKQTKLTIPVFLEHGSLLVMAGNTQSNWLHRLPLTTKVLTPRINLTFRTMNVQ